jgi:hypothetical protein
LTLGGGWKALIGDRAVHFKWLRPLILDKHTTINLGGG